MSAPDYKKIKSEYVTGTMSYRDLCDKYGISLGPLAAKAKREEWPRLRAEHQDKVATRAIHTAEVEQATRIARELLTAEAAAGSLIDACSDILSDPLQFKRHLIKVKDGDGEGYTERINEGVYSVADTRRLKDLATGLDIATRLSRTLKGILDEQARQKLEIERERLEIEKSKVAQQAALITDGIVITMEGDLEEWSQ